MANQINYPTGKVHRQELTHAATIPATVESQHTHLEISVAGAAWTLNLTVAAAIRSGARLIVSALSDGTARDGTAGTGFASGTPTLAGVISKRRHFIFEYVEGSGFVLQSIQTIN